MRFKFTYIRILNPMPMKSTFKTLLTILTVCISGALSAQAFEGVIMLKETHRNNVIAKRITVKGDKVKLETFGSADTTDLKGIKIVDLSSSTVTALLPSRKLYFNIPNKSANKPVNASVKTTDEKKTITVKSGDATQAYECKKVVVTSEARKARVSYWIAKGNFSFYSEMLSALNKHKAISDFFGKLAEKHPGTMPLKAKEERLDGTVIQSFEVTEITTKAISDTTFEIPADFSLMER